MNVFLWILQILLAAMFLAAGLMKLSQPKSKLAENKNMGWTNDFSENQIKLIAGSEVLGALGLILPWATGIAKILTPLAACGFVVIMVGAIVVHARRKEQWVMQAVLGILALVVAIFRF
jgi:uncharacterized membrane protein YphA (DoxX/SURF4 family)